MNRSTLYNITIYRTAPTEGGGCITQSLLRHTAHRQVVRPMEFRGTARGCCCCCCCCVHVPPLVRCGCRPHKSKRNSSVLSDHSRPRHPETPTTHERYRTHLSNNDWNDNHFRTGGGTERNYLWLGRPSAVGRSVMMAGAKRWSRFLFHFDVTRPWKQ